MRLSRFPRAHSASSPRPPRPPRSARSARRRPAGTAGLVTAGAALLLTGVPSVPAYAVPVTDYEMPFRCGQAWTGTTRSSHSPSVNAVDWNRPDNLGQPAVASAPGTVSVADTVDNSGYGRWVVVDHTDGESTLYAHLQSVAVAVGQRVDQGTMLGTVGETGRATGPHLHYEQRLDRRVVAPWFHGAPFRFGSTLASQNCVDVPLAANMVGSRVAELVVYRRATRATFRVRRPGQPPLVIAMGTALTDPVLGDWDGDGHADVGVRVPATRTFRLRTPAGLTRIRFGRVADRPIAGDWDGDGRWEVGVHRAGTDQLRLRQPDGSVRVVRLGDADDLPVTGDWNRDGVTDVGVYDQTLSRFLLRFRDAEGLGWTAAVRFGAAGDLPVAGDWDGNRRTDLGVWDPRTGRFELRQAAAVTSDARAVTTVPFGTPR